MINLACNDPAAVLGPQLILPTLRKLLARAREFHQAQATRDHVQVSVVKHTEQACCMPCGMHGTQPQQLHEMGAKAMSCQPDSLLVCQKYAYQQDADLRLAPSIIFAVILHVHFSQWCLRELRIVPANMCSKRQHPLPAKSYLLRRSGSRAVLLQRRLKRTEQKPSQEERQQRVRKQFRSSHLCTLTAMSTHLVLVL